METKNVPNSPNNVEEDIPETVDSDNTTNSSHKVEDVSTIKSGDPKHLCNIPVEVEDGVSVPVEVGDSKNVSSILNAEGNVSAEIDDPKDETIGLHKLDVLEMEIGVIEDASIIQHKADGSTLESDGPKVAPSCSGKVDAGSEIGTDFTKNDLKSPCKEQDVSESSTDTKQGASDSLSNVVDISEMVTSFEEVLSEEDTSVETVEKDNTLELSGDAPEEKDESSKLHEDESLDKPLKKHSNSAGSTFSQASTMDVAEIEHDTVAFTEDDIFLTQDDLPPPPPPNAEDELRKVDEDGPTVMCIEDTDGDDLIFSSQPEGSLGLPSATSSTLSTDTVVALKKRKQDSPMPEPARKMIKIDKNSAGVDVSDQSDGQESSTNFQIITTGSSGGDKAGDTENKSPQVSAVKEHPFAGSDSKGLISEGSHNEGGDANPINKSSECSDMDECSVVEESNQKLVSCTHTEECSHEHSSKIKSDNCVDVATFSRCEVNAVSKLSDCVDMDECSIIEDTQNLVDCKDAADSSINKSEVCSDVTEVSIIVSPEEEGKPVSKPAYCRGESIVNPSLKSSSDVEDGIVSDQKKTEDSSCSNGFKKCAKSVDDSVKDVGGNKSQSEEGAEKSSSPLLPLEMPSSAKDTSSEENGSSTSKNIISQKLLEPACKQKTTGKNIEIAEDVCTSDSHQIEMDEGVAGDNGGNVMLEALNDNVDTHTAVFKVCAEKVRTSEAATDDDCKIVGTVSQKGKTRTSVELVFEKSTDLASQQKQHIFLTPEKKSTGEEDFDDNQDLHLYFSPGEPEILQTPEKSEARKQDIIEVTPDLESSSEPDKKHSNGPSKCQVFTVDDDGPEILDSSSEVASEYKNKVAVNGNSEDFVDIDKQPALTNSNTNEKDGFKYHLKSLVVRHDVPTGANSEKTVAEVTSRKTSESCLSLKRKREDASNDVIYIQECDSGRDTTSVISTKQKRHKDNGSDTTSCVMPLVSALQKVESENDTPAEQILQVEKEIRVIVKLSYYEKSKQVISREVVQCDELPCGPQLSDSSGTLTDVSKTTSPSSVTSGAPFTLPDRRSIFSVVSNSSSSSAGSSASSMNIKALRARAEAGEKMIMPVNPAHSRSVRADVKNFQLIGAVIARLQPDIVPAQSNVEVEKNEAASASASNDLTGGTVKQDLENVKETDEDSDFKPITEKSISVPEKMVTPKTTRKTKSSNTKRTVSTRKLASESVSEEVQGSRSSKRRRSSGSTDQIVTQGRLRSSGKSHDSNTKSKTASPASSGKQPTPRTPKSRVKSDQGDRSRKKSQELALVDTESEDMSGSLVVLSSPEIAGSTPHSGSRSRSKKTSSPGSDIKTSASRSSRRKLGSVDEDKSGRQLHTVAGIERLVPHETGMQLTPGAQVFARWTDKRYYSGKIKEKGRDSRWKVAFDDGNEKEVVEDYIIEVKLLSERLLVYAVGKDGTYASGVIAQISRKGGKVLYGVDFDDEKMIFVPRASISFTEDQASILRERINTQEKGPSAASSPRTPRQASEVTLNNIVDGKRPRVAKKLSDSFERPGPSGQTSKPKSGSVTTKYKLSDTSSSEFDIDQVLGVESEDEEISASKVTSETASKLKGSRRNSTKKKEEEERMKLLGPIPSRNSKMFMGKYFLLTYHKDCKPKIPKRQTSSPETDYVVSSDLEASDTYSTSRSPFNKRYLKQQITAGGGTVVNTFLEFPSDQYSSCYLISNKPCLTANYLQCLAHGIMIIKHLWVIDKAKGHDVDASTYRLPRGICTKTRLWPEVAKKAQPLHRKRIIVVSHSENSAKFWKNILRATGATVHIQNLESDISHSYLVDVIVCDADVPQELKRHAQNIPVVKITWVQQCLITGEAVSYQDHLC